MENIRLTLEKYPKNKELSITSYKNKYYQWAFLEMESNRPYGIRIYTNHHFKTRKI